MQRFILALSILTSITLAACTTVDTTGLSDASTKTATGSLTALVTVTEYGDFQCPACGSAYPLIVKPMLQKYGSQIRYEFKQFPLQTLHVNALLAAQASECAADGGKFWQFVDLDYTNQKDLSRDSLYKWADQLGLDKDHFDRCLRSGIKKKAVLADYDAGVKLGVQGTPTFFVNGQKVESTIGAISKAIEASLNSASTIRL